MKVGVVGTLWFNIPPKGYGGTEEVVCNLVNGLVEKGHDVTLFAPATARVKAKLFSTVSKPLSELDVGWDNVAYTLFHMAQAFDAASNFDILHIHLNKAQDYIALILAEHSKTPVLFTPHFVLPGLRNKKDRHLLLEKYKNLPFTSISDSQRKEKDFNFVKTVYNGLDLKKFPFFKESEEFFVWLGRVYPVKGAREAVLAAKKAKVKLLLAGHIDSFNKESVEYFKKEVKPLIDGKKIIWVGEVGPKERVELLGKAKGFLNPILWEEPFGLVMAESQAFGTPVISFKRGSASELIIDGKTGFLVNNINEMAQKIKTIDKINRLDCRKNVEEKFTVEKMVEGYEEAYLKTIKNWKKYISRQKTDLNIPV